VAGRLPDRVEARRVATAGMVLCVMGLSALVFLGTSTPYWYIIAALCVLNLGFAFFATPITHTIMGSVPKSRVGMASATVAAMRQAGMNMSLGVATLVLALLVGQAVIEPPLYPALLTSIRVTFLILTALCLLGVGATLVARPRGRVTADAADGRLSTPSG
jgi:MFS family permease